MSTDLLGRFTERSRRVLELSLREALSLGHNYIGTEHILLGIVRDNEGLASRVLGALGITADDVRNETIRQLSGPKAKPDLDAELVERVAKRVVDLLDERSAA